MPRGRRGGTAGARLAAAALAVGTRAGGHSGGSSSGGHAIHGGHALHGRGSPGEGNRSGGSGGHGKPGNSSRHDDSRRHRRLKITNHCDREPIWIAHMASTGTGPDQQNLRLDPMQSHDFVTEDGLASTRYWPKMRCDAHGNGCLLGDSGGPHQICDETIGCAPPVDSKFEASFGMNGTDWVDVSLVDGWTLPFKFVVDGNCSAGDGNRAVRGVTDCSRLSLSQCPSSEAIGGKKLSLEVVQPGTNNVVGCYSPCSKLTLSQWGNDGAQGVTPADRKASSYCCPTPPETPEACRKGPVEGTKFVKAVHKHCPGVYGYSYDDGMGLITCPKTTRYEMIFFCPDNGTDQAEIDGATPGAGSGPNSTGSSSGSGGSGKKKRGGEADDGHGVRATPAEGRRPGRGNRSGSGGSAQEAGGELVEPGAAWNQYCADPAVYSGHSSGLEDCQRRCRLNPDCGFLSHWQSRGHHWCRLTQRCDKLRHHGAQPISIYRKDVQEKSAPEPAPAPATPPQARAPAADEEEGNATARGTCCFLEREPGGACRGGCASGASAAGGPCAASREGCRRCLAGAVWCPAARGARERPRAAGEGVRLWAAAGGAAGAPRAAAAAAAALLGLAAAALAAAALAAAAPALRRAAAAARRLGPGAEHAGRGVGCPGGVAAALLTAEGAAAVPPGLAAAAAHPLP